MGAIHLHKEINCLILHLINAVLGQGANRPLLLKSSSMYRGLDSGVP